MIRVVIDTNVFLSALYFTKGNPWRIVTWAIEGKIQNISSGFILEEVRTVLKKKFHWQSHEIDKAIYTIESFSEIIFTNIHLNIIKCAADNRILECAIAGNADFIISGDHHMTELREFKGITIVNPAEFLAIVGREDLPEQ